MQTVKIDELIPDAKNANKGTDRGRKALLDSLKRYGGGRSGFAFAMLRYVGFREATQP